MRLVWALFSVSFVRLAGALNAMDGLKLFSFGDARGVPMDNVFAVGTAFVSITGSSPGMSS